MTAQRRKNLLIALGLAVVAIAAYVGIALRMKYGAL
jgi:hypothetical protein